MQPNIQRPQSEEEILMNTILQSSNRLRSKINIEIDKFTDMHEQLDKFNQSSTQLLTKLQIERVELKNEITKLQAALNINNKELEMLKSGELTIEEVEQAKTNEKIAKKVATKMAKSKAKIP